MKTDKPKSRLGRGLSSLLAGSNEYETPALPVMIELPAQESALSDTQSEPAIPLPPATTHVTELNPQSITPNPHQPRRLVNEESIADLAASLRSTGLIQPVIVRQVPGGYQLIAGERRWRAAKLAGLSTIPAIVRQADSATQAQMALVENIQREDLNPIDRAESYRSLMDQLGLTQAELAGRLGEERSGIGNYVRLLNLTDSVREQVRLGALSFGHAKILAGIEDILHQKQLAERVLKESLSVRQLERLVQEMLQRTPTKIVKKEVSAHLHDLEQSLTRQLGLRVQLQSKGKRGRLTIHYSSLDEFDGLLNRMNVRTEA